MGNVLKFIMLAVGVIIVAVLIANVVSLQSTGKSLLDTGKALLTNSTAAYADVDKTMYDGSSVAGSQVIELIKQYWQPENSIAITVRTADGVSIMYDYSGQNYDLAKSGGITGFPPEMGKFTDTLSVSGAVKKGVGLVSLKASTSGDPTVNDTVATATTKTGTGNAVTGYGENTAKPLGYINKNSGVFIGSIQYDSNGNIRGIAFVQK